MVKHLRLFSLFSLLIISSCSTVDIDYHMPLNRFETPEISGDKWDGYIHTNIGNTQEVTLTEVYDDNIFGTGPTFDDGPKMERSFAFGWAAGVSLFKNTEVFYRGLHDSPDQIGFKYQMMGENRLKKELGHKMAFTFSYGTTDREDGNVTIKSDTSSTIREYNTNLKITSWDFSWLYGYRFKDWFLVYGNFYWTQYKVESTLSSTVHTDVDVRGIAKTKGFLAGVKFEGTKKPIFCLLETGLVNSNWSGDIITSNATFGFSLGSHF